MSEIKSVTESTADWAMRRSLSLVSEFTTGSTNDDAKIRALTEKAGFVLFLTAHQSRGRGRGTNVWIDNGAGRSLLSTWSFHAPQAPQAITAPRVGLALYRAVVRSWPTLPWSLKAPNDLYLDQRKVAGLLVETVTNGRDHRLLVGLGFNILAHPSQVATATDLRSCLGHAPSVADWSTFLDTLKAEFSSSVVDAARAELGDGTRQELKNALNRNLSRTFDVEEVSPHGDLIHAGGRVRWIDL